MFISIRARSNNALNINPPNADRTLSTHGSDWLWAVTALMAITFLAWLIWTLLLSRRQLPNKHAEAATAEATQTDEIQNSRSLPRERIFHYLFTIAAFIGFITYFTMASDLGSTPVRQYMNVGDNMHQTRQVFYTRYIYWFITWPLLLVATLLLSGVSWATMLFLVALQEIWLVSWLCGALTSTSYKWGYFSIGVFAYVLLAYLLFRWGLDHAREIQSAKVYTMLVGLLVVVWIAFPVAWGLSEGSNRLSVTGEMIFYGILDLLIVPVYGSIFLGSIRRLGDSLFPFTQRGRVWR